MLFPDTPKHPDQRYLLSPKGNELLQILISLEKQVKPQPTKNPIVSEGSRNDVGMMSERCRKDVGKNLVIQQPQYLLRLLQNQQ